MAKSEKNLNAVFQDTANAIRNKKSSSNKITPRDFADEINSIPTGIEPTGSIDITTNGEHNVAQYGTADVQVCHSLNDFIYNVILDDTPKYSERDKFVLRSDVHSLFVSSTISWYQVDDPCDLSLVPGGHPAGNYFSDGFIAIGDLGLPEDNNHNQEWELHFSIAYSDYYGSYTEEELTSMWQEFFNQTIYIRDVSGRYVGIVGTVYLYVECRSGC